MVLKKALFPVFAHRSALAGITRHVPGTPSACAKTPGKQGSTRTDDVALTECFHSLDEVRTVRAVRVRALRLGRREASDELCLSASSCTNEHVLVPAGESSRQYKCRNR